MTPFHIRERLKKLLGRRAPGGSTGERFEVEFLLPDGSSHRVETEAHYTLHMASQLLETPIDSPCPDGHCGHCQVRVLDDGGGLAPPTRSEAEILDRELGADRDPAIRLACHARLKGPGVRIQVLKTWSLDQLRGAPV